MIRILLIAALFWGSGGSLQAGTVLSFSGTLNTPEVIFTQTFTIGSAQNVEVRTYGFGGGTNGSGTLIAPGGFDPLVALFSGDLSTASILTDASSNPVAGADTLTLFTGNCPPAGMVTIGSGAGSSVCGDVLLQVNNLAAGTYTLLLTDANYVPFAVNPGPPASSLLSDGFGDLTGGVFQTCNVTSSGTTCITPSNQFAVDLVEQGTNSTVPEPSTGVLLGLGSSAIFLLKTNRRKEK